MFSPEIVTLHLEDSFARILVARGRSVRYWREVALPPGLIHEGIVQRVNEAAVIVNDLLNQGRCGRGDVRVSLPANGVLCRTLTLPPIGRHLLDATIQREMRREALINLAESHLFWQPLPQPDHRGPSLRVFALVVPREMVRSTLRLLDAAHVGLHSLDLKPLALARALQVRRAIIADLEPGKLEAILVADGVPVTLRALPVDSRDLPGLTSELVHTIQFYAEQPEVSAPSPKVTVYLTGALADLSPLLDALRKATGLAPETLAPAFRYASDFPVSRYVANLGLVLKKGG